MNQKYKNFISKNMYGLQTFLFYACKFQNICFTYFYTDLDTFWFESHRVSAESLYRDSCFFTIWTKHDTVPVRTREAMSQAFLASLMHMLVFFVHLNNFGSLFLALYYASLDESRRVSI